MKIHKYECLKVIKSPVIWLLLVSFLVLNVLQIRECTGMGVQENKDSVKSMHKAVLMYGVDLNHSKVENPASDYGQSYKEYVKTYSSLYDSLDMMSILKQKEKIYNYHPTGAYAHYIEQNYKKLQGRVQEMKQSGEGNYGFYPGLIYEFHSTLYGKIGQNLLIEMAVLVVLCVLLLMDYERIHKTRDIVIATKVGKKSMKKKAFIGCLFGLFYSGLLMLGTYLYFFLHISFQGLWKVPIASSIMAEKQGLLFYPFITFWKLTEIQYFILNILTSIGFLVLIAGITIALQLLLQNSYFTFLVESLFYMGLYVFAWYFEAINFLDVIIILMNPITLWRTCGSWFMEADLRIAFAGNEFWCLGSCAIITILVLLVGKRRYAKLEIK